ncbi:hypothetical protein KR505_19340 [Eubacterium callanderi]|uniref:hypothetical protein n=1 Tax=Eubacterium callanderi TaxID=53442 RepID=UPI001C2DCC55|nr:hypothetical protein [Eubacterium callanderi]MBV1685555.1 hypothetical protein [Eubacterium callanderi]
MGKNYMPEIARMLGVEIGEEFDILYKDGTAMEDGPLKFTNETILDCDGDDLQCWRLCCLLTGDYTIQRRQWRPKEGRLFWFVLSDGSTNWGIFRKNNANDLALLNMGNCSPSEEAAKAAVPEMLAKFEEIKKGVRE